MRRGKRRVKRGKGLSFNNDRCLDILYERQHGKCHYCKTAMTLPPVNRSEREFISEREASVDHLLPKSRGGSNSRFNLVAACRSCNNRKGSWSADEFIAILAVDRR